MNVLARWFKREEPSEKIALQDLDIVKLSLISWTERLQLGSSKKFICSTFTCSLFVVLVQAIILGWLALDVTDITFCGDIVRHLKFGSGSLENFFEDDGLDTHKKYQDMWVNNFSQQAKEEIEFERNRQNPYNYDPSCSEDSVIKFSTENRLKAYLDKECKTEIPVTEME